MRTTALEGFCAALLPPEAGGPPPAELSARVAAYLHRTPVAARSGARLVALACEAVALVTGRSRIADLDLAARERALRRAAATIPGGLAVEAVKAIVLLAHGSAQFADLMHEQAQSRPPARPDAQLDVTHSADWPSRTSADVVVIGSGAGGAVAARTLARRGLDTVVVEEGREHPVEEFRSGDPLDRFADLYRDGGTTVAIGRPAVVLPIGRGVGGSTLVNSGTCYRTPERVRAEWESKHRLDLATDGHYQECLDEIERTLQVAPVPDEVMGRNGGLMLLGAEKLGWRAAPLVRNAPGCGGCCQCSIGCPRNAKYGVHLNALPQAVAAGARIVSDARVRRIVVENGRAVGIEARRLDGSTLRIDADRVVVAAGATESPALLRRSSLGRHPRAGRNLAIHPAVGAAGRFEERVTSWRGVLQSASVEAFHDSEGILLEATATPPGMGSMLLPGLGRPLLAELDRADHLATLGAMVADEPRGRVLGSRHTAITYRMARNDGRRLLRSIEIMGRVLFAAGASEVLTGLPRHPVVNTVEALVQATATARPRELHVAAFHPTGTLAAGGDPECHPVDGSGRLRGVRGVWVTDASILPSCPTVNPQMSIMALALAAAEQI